MRVGVLRIIGAERGLARFLEEPEQQRNRHCGGRESNNDGGDDQCLRHEIATRPAAAPLRATTPNSRNTPFPSRLKARILRSGWGFTMSPNNPSPTSVAPQSPNNVAAFIVVASVPAGPLNLLAAVGSAFVLAFVGTTSVAAPLSLTLPT